MEFFTAGRSGAGPNGGGRTTGNDIQRVISSHAEAAKIGRHIADEVMEEWRNDSSASNSPASNQVSSSPSYP